MLIRFSVENFLSFRDETELSMVPGKARQHPKHIVSTGKNRKTNLLKTAVIYGANASGKSNLIKAMDFARDFIISGRRPGKTIPVKPFKFDSASEEKPSTFQFEFTHKGKSLIYGFKLDAQKVYEEWLYEITPNTEKPMFERMTGADDQTTAEFSMKLKAKDLEFLQFVARGTRPNQLFLTESIERNVPYFRNAFEWFDKVLVIIFPESRLEGLEIEFMTNEDFQQSFQSLLQLFDTGISGISFQEFDFDEEISISKQFKEQVKEELFKREDSFGTIVRGAEGQSYLLLKRDNDAINASKLMTVHHAKGQEQHVLLDVREESDGTKRLFDLIPALIELFSSERVFIIDELDRSLHPHVSREILRLFLSNKPEQMSQLMVTTHESTLLDLDLLRRDEIWFVEKDQDGASTIYSLEEFAPRYDKDIRKGYLLGRFGSIPLIKDVENLGSLN